MKIALCFSGGIRYLRSTLPSIFKYFINPLKENNNEVDIFLNLTYINEMDNKIKNKFKMVRSEFLENELIDILKPKKYKIYEFNGEVQKNDMNVNGKNFYNYNWGSEKNENYGYSAFGMYSKIYQCDLLRQEYEKENNFKYDFVWRGRLDYIYLDYIKLEDLDNLSENKVYLIKDRYAHNTKLELNDKFFGAKSDMMSKLTNLYNELPYYLDKFKKENIFFDGQFLINNKIKDLKKELDIEVKMIGHRNTYYKCQCRHKIPKKNKNILVNLSKKQLNEDIIYKLLYLGFKVYNLSDNSNIKLFENNRKINSLDEIKELNFKFIVSDKISNLKCSKNIVINNDLQEKKINKNTVILKVFSKIDVSDIIRGFIEYGFSKNYYEIKKDSYDLILNDLVKYYIPDRGPKRGKITKILKLKKINKYEIDKNRYFFNEIKILNYEKYIV